MLLIFGLNIGGNELSWSHPAVLTILPLSGVFFIVFLVVEKYAREPILPLRLLSHRTPLAAGLVVYTIKLILTYLVKLVLFHGSLFSDIQSTAFLPSGLGSISCPGRPSAYSEFRWCLVRLPWIWHVNG